MDGAERIISVEPSLLSPVLNNETGYLSLKLRTTKCSKFFEDDHTGFGINAFSSIIIIVQKITTKHESSTILIIVFVLYNRLPPRPTTIGIKIKGRRITGVSTEQKLMNEF